ncbi:MAG TPA: hypothetical protein PLV06_06645 [Bacteroidales bacterium]|nr:hypothetical protein [Bacteroidales bacterium]HPR12043.1 hypothetical protein [Bacteroidales bacterium]HRW85918.1 hypothetical protein [Bacteroidales bacterium]
MLIKETDVIYTCSSLRKNRLIILLAILLMSCSMLAAQKTRGEAPPLRERIFFGGSLGLQFGTLTDIDVSPVVGLWVLPRLNVAAGPKYRFMKYYDERVNVYGGRVYSQFYFIQDFDNVIPLGVHLGLFLHAEDEFYTYKYSDGVSSESYFINTPLVGGGISQPLGRRSSMNIMFLFALEDTYEIYADPTIRISFTF